MRDYEMMVILHPDQDAAGIKSSLEGISARISQDGEVTRMDLLGRRKLAYGVRKVHQGTYGLLNFTVAPDKIDGIKRHLQIDMRDQVIRYLLLIDEKRGIRPPAQPMPETEPEAVEAAEEEDLTAVVFEGADGEVIGAAPVAAAEAPAEPAAE